MATRIEKRVNIVPCTNEAVRHSAHLRSMMPGLESYYLSQTLLVKTQLGLSVERMSEQGMQGMMSLTLRLLDAVAEAKPRWHKSVRAGPSYLKSLRYFNQKGS